MSLKDLALEAHEHQRTEDRARTKKQRADRETHVREAWKEYAGKLGLPDSELGEITAGSIDPGAPRKGIQNGLFTVVDGITFFWNTAYNEGGWQVVATCASCNTRFPVHCYSLENVGAAISGNRRFLHSCSEGGAENIARAAKSWERVTGVPATQILDAASHQHKILSAP
jgi:hypothetical protein